MADDDKESKTQDPTQKRLDDALEKGDVAKSQEVNTWFVIGASTLLLSSFSGTISQGIEVPMRNLLMNMHQIRVDGPGLLQLLSQLELMLIGVLGIPLLLLLIAGVGSNLIQHRLVFSTEPLTPKFSKISPAAGFAASSKEERDIVESYKLGVNAYIVKPVDFDKFVKAISEIGFFWLLLNQPPK